MLPNLPLPDIEQWETRAVLKKAAEAHRYLAELKGVDVATVADATSRNFEQLFSGVMR